VLAGTLDNAQIGAGSMIKHAVIRNSILGRDVWVNEGSVIEDSIVMDYCAVGKGVHLRRVIVDRFNIIGSNTEIGLDPQADRRRYHVDPASGLVVIPRGGRREFLLRDEP
jgi:glucose-1-phosphate adenylyltransferase